MDDFMRTSIDNINYQNQAPLRTEAEVIALRKELADLKAFIVIAVKVMATPEQVEEITRMLNEA
jgi:hypothetical protein